MVGFSLTLLKGVGGRRMLEMQATPRGEVVMAPLGSISNVRQRSYLKHLLMTKQEGAGAPGRQGQGFCKFMEVEMNHFRLSRKPR
jgi:hypothetical protein